jgi:hypothetical protein
MNDSDNPYEGGETTETPETLETPETTEPMAAVDTSPVVTEDPLYEVTVQGKKMKLPLSEIRNGYQRNRDYTQKTMSLAAEREAWLKEKTELTRKTEELRAWMQNPQNLKQYHDYLVQQQGYETPDQPMTAAQVQQMLARERAQQTQERQKELQTQQSQFELKQQAAVISGELNQTLKGLLEANPELSSIDGIEALLHKDVAAQEPESVEEAKRMFAEAVQKRSEKIRSLFTNQQKVAAVQKGKLTMGIQPPGGTGVVPTPQKKMDLGSPELLQSVVSDLMNSKKEI